MEKWRGKNGKQINANVFTGKRKIRKRVGVARAPFGGGSSSVNRVL